MSNTITEMGLILLAVVLAMAAPYGLYKRYIQHAKLKLQTTAAGDLFISYRWIHTVDIFVGLWTILFLMLLIGAPSRQPSQNPPPLYLYILLALVWFFLLYAALTGLVNRTKVFFARDGRIITTYGPLPYFRKPYQEIRDVTLVYPEKRRYGGRLPPYWRYIIWAEYNFGNKVQLIHTIDSERDMTKVMEKINQQLAKQGA